MAAYKFDKGAHAVYTLPSGGENVKGGNEYDNNKWKKCESV